MIKHISYIIGILFLLACGEKSPCFKSTGKIITEERLIESSIRNIYLEDEIELVLTQSDNPYLSVEAGENLLPYIETIIEGDKITIRNNNTCNFLRSYKNKIQVNLSTKSLRYISYSGTENISATNTIVVDTLEIETIGVGDIIMDVDIDDMLNVFQHEGPSDFYLSGESTNSYLYSRGKGWFYLQDLTSQSAFINHNGTGDFNLKVIDDLFIDLYSIGNVGYYGSPTNVSIGVKEGSGLILAK